MKTADLIPFILIELNECDKYGFELTKAIETKSNGEILIKQPTLYTLLKKLEKSKFITSYWKDSEIGGKRHYYKITQNGRMQVATLPSYEALLGNVSSNSVETDENIEDVVPVTEERRTTSIMDELLNSNIAKPTESIISTSEVFDDSNIDTATELEINAENSNILKTEKDAIDEQFATNENVMKFTETVQTSSPAPVVHENIVSHEFTTTDIFDADFTVPKNQIEIKHVDYVDFKNNDNYKKSKALSTKMLYQTLSTSASLVLVIALCSLITSFTGRSVLYYCFFICSVLTALFYPVLCAVNMEKTRLKYQEETYNSKFKLKIYIGISLMLTVLIVCIVVNIAIKNTSFASMLHIKNFANLYAPLLLTSVYFLDVLFNRVFLSKLNK